MTVAHGPQHRRCTTLVNHVWNRGLRRASPGPRRRGRRAAPDGVPRLRLGRRRGAGRRRRADRAQARRPAGQPRGGTRRDRCRRALVGGTGIGHTRWATHGGPPTATPTRTSTPAGRFAVVHNGIIENFADAARRARGRRRRVRQRHRHRGRRAPARPRLSPAARPPATSSAGAGGAARGSRAPSPWSFAHADDPDTHRRRPPVHRRWWSASATARCSSAPMSPRSSSTPATPSNSARTRSW